MYQVISIAHTIGHTIHTQHALVDNYINTNKKGHSHFTRNNSPFTFHTTLTNITILGYTYMHGYVLEQP